MEIEVVPAFGYRDEVKKLFKEYTDNLVEHEPAFRKYLDEQNYDEEVENLEMKYGMPWGRLYLLLCDGRIAGSIGLKKFDEESCEIKRLYIRPEFRGHHLSDILLKKFIDDAREIGYKYILLDTFPFLESAIHIYKKLGFYEIESYNNSPMDNLIYLKYDL